MMKIGNRSIKKVLGSVFEKRHWVSLSNMFSTVHNPIKFLFHYLSGRGKYPNQITVNSSNGPITIQLFSHDDLLTVNEIFFRLDYHASSNINCVVDLGSNIGVSALYFLSLNPHCKVYLYEPVPSNLERLESNLRNNSSFGRTLINSCAVGDLEGTVSFGTEETGRYGGIGVRSENEISVKCLHINTVISEILKKHDSIDVLKIDTEGNEKELLTSISDNYLSKIKLIHCEYPSATTPDLKGFSKMRRGNIVTYAKI